MDKMSKLFTAEEVLALVKASSAGKALIGIGAFVAGGIVGVVGKDKIVQWSGKAISFLRR